MALLAQQTVQPQHIGRAVGVGKADRLRGIVAELGIEVRQFLNGAVFAAHLAAQDDLALLIALQDGLDVQDRPCQLRAAGDAPALVQVLQVIHDEELLHPAAHAAHALDQLLHRRARLRALRDLDGDQSLAEGRAAAVDHAELAARILCHQLVRRETHAPAGTADAAGNADIQQVIPCGQHRLHPLGGILRVDHRGLDLRTAADGIVVRWAVELALRQLAVDAVRQRKRPDVILLQHLRRQIGRRIRKNANHGNSSCFQFINCAAASPPACQTAAGSRP